jgi:hypothetical protein
MRQDGQAVWEALLAPVGSCDRQHVTIKPARRRGGPALQPSNPDAPEVFLDNIEAGPLPFDPPAMPPDVLSLASLFSSHPEAW